MGLMSRIINSGMYNPSAVAAALGSGFVPTAGMLNPPAIHARQINDLSQLVAQIKEKGSEFPVTYKAEDGSVQRLTGYRLSGYNLELQSDVEFRFVPIGQGYLETRIEDSELVEDDLFFSEEIGSISLTHALVILDGGTNPPNGIPDAAYVEIGSTRHQGEEVTPENPVSVQIRRQPLSGFPSDPKVQRDVNGEYLLALMGTDFLSR